MILFVLNTGYFLSFKTEYSVRKKVFSIWKECIFYSLLILFFDIVVLHHHIENADFLKSLFPIMLRNWGFVNNYIFLVLLSPVINLYLRTATDDSLRKLILLLSVIQCIVPYITMNDSFNTGYGNSIVWFCFIYILAFYVRKNRIQEKYSIYQLFCIALICVALTFGSKIIIAILSSKIYGEIKFSSAFVGETPLLNLIYSLALFCILLKVKIKNLFISKTIYRLSSGAFSVYLVHEHPLVRKQLWNKLNVLSFAQSEPIIFVVHWFLSIVVIYAAILVIDVIRQRLFICFEKMIIGAKVKRYRIE